MSNADLIAEARRWTTPPVQAHVPYDLLDMVGALAAALESQPAPLVADSREALVAFIEENAGADWLANSPEGLVDELLASGVVSLPADRDRATAERAWDEGFAIGLNFDSDNYGFTNPYRESEARNE